MFYAVAFDPIKIWTCLAPHNDHQHLSLLRIIMYVVGKNEQKWSLNGQTQRLSLLNEIGVYEACSHIHIKTLQLIFRRTN